MRAKLKPIACHMTALTPVFINNLKVLVDIFLDKHNAMSIWEQILRYLRVIVFLNILRTLYVPITGSQEIRL